MKRVVVIVWAMVFCVPSYVHSMGDLRWKSLVCAGVGLVASFVVWRYVAGVHREFTELRRENVNVRRNNDDLRERLEDFIRAYNSFLGVHNDCVVRINLLSHCEMVNKKSIIDIKGQCVHLGAKLHVYDQNLAEKHKELLEKIGVMQERLSGVERLVVQ